MLAVTAAAYQRTAPGFTRTRLESAATLAGGLALTGGSGLQAAMSQRLAAIEAAEQLGDPDLTARVIGNFDVPAIWTRSDDPAAAARIVAAAERTLSALPAGRDALRARLLATIAVESRGDPGRRPGQAAAEAEAIARRLGDPALLAFALNGAWMQSFSRTGLAARRDAIGARDRGARHPARAGQLRDPRTAHPAAGAQRARRLHRRRRAGRRPRPARRAPRKTARHRVHPLVPGHAGARRPQRTRPGAEEGYRQAATLLDQSGMPGVARAPAPGAAVPAGVAARARRSSPTTPTGAPTGPGRARGACSPATAPPRRGRHSGAARPRHPAC